jgi:hypothetical protein
MDEGIANDKQHGRIDNWCSGARYQYHHCCGGVDRYCGRVSDFFLLGKVE